MVQPSYRKPFTLSFHDETQFGPHPHPAYAIPAEAGIHFSSLLDTRMRGYDIHT
jgi:hypothetical protein